MDILKNIFIDQQNNLVNYHHLLLTQKKTLVEIGKESDEILHLSDENFNCSYLNPAGCRWFGRTKDSIINLKDKFIQDYYHPDTQKFELPKIKIFFQDHHPDMLYTNYHQIFNQAVKAYSICLVFIKKVKSKGFLCITLPLEDQIVLTKKIKRLISEDAFREHHLNRFKQLTERETEILTLLANGMNNPEISNALCISRQTVEQHRKHINKKLHIHSMKDILDYAYAFDLV